jgi:hypothetical protein
VALIGAGGVALPAEGAQIDLIPSNGGRAVTVQSDAAGRYEATLAACATYSVRASKRDCYATPEAATFDPSLAPSQDGTAALPDIVYRMETLPVIDTFSDRIPCFITGYWYPTTTRLYRELRERIARNELGAASFINPDDYAYSDHLAAVDGKFEAIYAKLEEYVRLLDNGCMPRTTPLTITIVGYVDTLGLTRGRYPDATVRTTDAELPGRRLTGMTIQENDILAGQAGNVKLSHLRAFYTYREIDRVMSERSPRYAALKSAGRIVWKYCGGRLPQSAHGEYRADPDCRRFDIVIQ